MPRHEYLYGQTLPQLEALCNRLEMPRFAAKQIARWLYDKHATTIEAMSDLSARHRALLAETYEVGLTAPEKVSISTDGTKKYLYRTSQNHFIESAYIPDGDRATLCISSQAGCRMGCRFCATGRQGLQHSLSTNEILNQIGSLPERERLTNVVFMGMGEPLDNLDSLLPLAVVSLTSYTLADLLGSTPIYTALLENLLRPEDKAAARRNRPGEKVLKTYVIPLGSALDGKCIKDIDWGRHCLIVSIERGDTAVTPKGDTTLHAGDTLVVMVSQRRFARDNDRLETLIAPKS